MKSGLMLQKWNVLSKYVNQLTKMLDSKSSAATRLENIGQELDSVRRTGITIVFQH